MDPRDLAVAALSRLPLRLADVLAWLLAWTWWWLLPVRRAVAVENLRRALPEVPPRPTLTRMMHDLVLGYVELARYHRETVAGVRPRTVTVDVEVPPGGVPPGVLVLTGHGGAWDLVLVASALVVPLSIFLRTPTDPWARARIAEVRDAHGVGALETGATMDAAYAALAEGRSVYFVQDQSFPKGLPVPFFGRPARTSAGLAAAHLRTGRPIWCAWGERLGVGRHRFAFREWTPPPRTGDRAADVAALTEAANRFYEERIRAAPHGWLWLHRRWK